MGKIIPWKLKHVPVNEMQIICFSLKWVSAKGTNSRTILCLTRQLFFSLLIWIRQKKKNAVCRVTEKHNHVMLRARMKTKLQLYFDFSLLLQSTDAEDSFHKLLLLLFFFLRFMYMYDYLCKRRYGSLILKLFSLIIENWLTKCFKGKIYTD